jgi:SAM-dependent methyltransferase
MSRTWHYGLVARWWAEFNVDGDDIAVFRELIGGSGTPALDAGCGTGRVLVPLLRAGLDVDGSDASTDMLRWCRERAEAAGLKVALFAQAMHELDLPRRYRTIIVAGAFGVGSNRTEDLEGLRRLYSHLEPGGVLLLDHHLPNLERAATTWNDWIQRPDLPRPFPDRGKRRTAADGTELELRTRLARFDPFEQTAVVEMEIVHTSGNEVLASERHSVDLGLYFKPEIELMLRHVGFADIEVTAFGDDRPPDPWNDVRIAIQARRP